MKNRIIEASILAIGLIIMGLAIRSGIGSFSQRDRVVNVKGLAEREMLADKVIWPIVYKEVGNNLTTLYENLNAKNETIIAFLQSNGIKQDEISIAAPQVIDMEAERYNQNNFNNRYNITSIITVSSNKVELVQKLLGRQAELLTKGVAVVGSDYQYNVLYSFTKLNEIKPQMIEEATKNAREAAEKFANDSDSKLGKIKSANQGQFSINDRDANTPHIKNIRVVSSIEYYLKD